MNGGMSAIGTKRTSQVALHMSAFGGKADIFWFLSRIATCRTLLKKITILSQPFPTAFDSMSSCARTLIHSSSGRRSYGRPQSFSAPNIKISTGSNAKRLELDVGQAKKPSKISIRDFEFYLAHSLARVNWWKGRWNSVVHFEFV